MRKVLILAVMTLTVPAHAASYYFSSSTGSDLSGAGTQASPWQTFAGASNHLNSSTFTHGDTIYLKRGDTWSGDQLIPPSSGTSGSPIAFDAYGTGPAPVITAAAPILPFTTPTGDPWSVVSGTVYKATIPSVLSSGTVNMVRFGNIYGRKKTGTCSAAVSNKYDFCVTWPFLYVYSNGVSPVTTYASDGSIVPIVGAGAGLQMIYVSGKSWLTFQHIVIQNFDYVGVGVAGASDNLVFANMESDGMVPYGTTPLGFYVNATNPGSVQFLNDEVRAHDFGWGAANDRNLLGRFGTQTFSLPRLARAQNYFLRLYDNSSPPRYSRYAAALHVDYPL